MSTKDTYVTMEAESRRENAWVARVIGTDPKFGVAREFIGRSVGKNGKRADVTEVGVYEEAEGPTRRYWLVYEHPETGLAAHRLNLHNALALAVAPRERQQAEGLERAIAKGQLAASPMTDREIAEFLRTVIDLDDLERCVAALRAR